MKQLATKVETSKQIAYLRPHFTDINQESKDGLAQVGGKASNKLDVKSTNKGI